MRLCRCAPRDNATTPPIVHAFKIAKIEDVGGSFREGPCRFRHLVGAREESEEVREWRKRNDTHQFHCLTSVDKIVESVERKHFLQFEIPQLKYFTSSNLQTITSLATPRQGWKNFLLHLLSRHNII
jgi:hypothetical protein